MAEGKAGPVFFRDVIFGKLPGLQGQPHAHPGSSQETQWAEKKEQMILEGNVTEDREGIK